jgi:putative tryptophan/tyrosine transport system substrate-binding protein
VRRRDFITLLGGAAAALPLAARAQQPAMPVIGFLRSGPAASSAHFVGGFQRGLGEAGFFEGQNVAIDYRWAEDQTDRLPAIATELVQRRVAVIVATGIAMPALKAATTAIPIVFVTGYDPVRTGFVTNLSRPGGNVTGVVFTITDLAAKRLGLLHELVPKAAVIAVLLDPNQLDVEVELRGAEAAAHALGRQILIVKATGDHEFKAAFATIMQAGAGALLIGGSPAFINQRRQLVALTVRHALPTSFPTRDYPEAGGLMSYGPSIADAYRRAGTYAGRIIKGEKPGDLPVELASKFELIINLATAKAIDFEIPPTLLARADEVIE